MLRKAYNMNIHERFLPNTRLSCLTQRCANCLSNRLVILLGKRVASAFGIDAEYFEIDTELGHSSGGPDAAKWAPRLAAFIKRLAD